MNLFQTLINRLIDRIDVERVFKFSLPLEGEEKEQLLLVVNPVKGLAPKALAPIVSLCMSDTMDLPFDLIIAGEWLNKVKQGSLYYTYMSLPEHQCYVSKKKPNVLFTSKNMNGLLELSQFNYTKSKEVSDEFRTAVDNFLTKKDYAQATFMLHQFVEFRLKGFQAIAGINGGKGHNLEHLLKTVRNIAPQLQEIFPYDSVNVHVLRKLDQSYVKAKKPEQIEICEEEFVILLEKSELACREMDNMVESMMARISAHRDGPATGPEKRSSSEMPKDHDKAIDGTKGNNVTICEDFSTFPWPQEYKNDAHKLLDKIRTDHNPEQIMMLNYHTGAFSGSYLFQQNDRERDGVKVELYLVVVMKNTGPFHFKSVQAGTASALLLYLSVKELEKKLASGNRFVHTAWTKGHVLRRKSSFNPSFAIKDVDWKREYEEMERVAENAKMCMNNLYSMLNNSSSVKLDSAFLVSRNIYEIGVNTYNRCMINYLPSRLSLMEQTEWSALFDRSIIDFAYPDSDIQRARMIFIMDQEHVWWQNKEVGISRVSKSEYRAVAREVKLFFEAQLDKVLEQLKPWAEAEVKSILNEHYQ